MQYKFHKQKSTNNLQTSLLVMPAAMLIHNQVINTSCVTFLPMGKVNPRGQLAIVAILYGAGQWKAWHINSSSPGQNGCHLADGIFRCIFVNEKVCILNKISLKFVASGPVDNNLALV